MTEDILGNERKEITLSSVSLLFFPKPAWLALAVLRRTSLKIILISYGGSALLSIVQGGKQLLALETALKQHCPGCQALHALKIGIVSTSHPPFKDIWIICSNIMGCVYNFKISIVHVHLKCLY